MDPLSIAVSTFQIADATSRVLGRDTVRRYRLLSRNYGFIIAIWLSITFPGTASRYERIENDILNGPPENAETFRQAITDECNMTAVAGAIIAQVAITGLSLPNLSATHWLAHSLLLLAIVSGCLSVYFACILQRAIGKLYHPDQIRNWLRLPPPPGITEADAHASFAAVFIVAAPFALVKVSIFSFLLGLAIYQGFVWTKSLDPTAAIGESRNVFITFIVANGVCLCFFSLTFSAKSIENLLRTGRTSIVSASSWDSERHHNSSNRQPPELMRKEKMALPQGHEPMHPRSAVDEILVTDLASALQHAAQAHIQCAEADRHVAFEYAKLSSSG